MAAMVYRDAADRNGAAPDAGFGATATHPEEP